MRREYGQVEQRLQEWALWVTSGQRGSGYATKSVLHESWSPPTGTPTPRLGAGDSEWLNWETHRAIGELPLRLRSTVVACYTKRMTVTQQAALLKCAESTVYSRLQVARRTLWEKLRRR